jgi:uncharacterized protein (TIRG00374 family)
MLIAAAVAVGSAVVLIGLTASRETLSSLARLDWRWLVVTAGLWLAAVSLDGARLSVVARIAGRRFSVLESAELILIGWFMAAVTPFQAGGLPLQLYLLRRRGIAPGEASAILLGRGIVYYALVFAVAPLAAVRLGVSAFVVRAVAGYAAVVVVTGSLVVFAGLCFPRLPGQARAALERRPRTRVRRFFIRLLGEFGGFLDGLRTILHPRQAARLGLVLLLTAGYACAYFGMSAALLAGLGVRANPLVAATASLLLSSVLISIPTPGSAGVAEAGAAVLYALVCPKPLLGVFVVLWRMVSFYLGALVGGIATFRRLAEAARAVLPSGSPRPC